MKLFDFSFYPYLRPSVASKNGVPVYMRISHQGLRKDYSINLKVDPAVWDDEFKQVRGRGKETNHQNLRIKQELDKIQEAIRDLYDEFGHYSLDQLYARIKNGNKPIQVLAFFEEVMADNELRIQSGDLKPNTQKVYKTSYRHLNHFINGSLKRNDFPVKTIDYTFLQKLELFLRGAKGIGQNASNKYLKTLKAVLNEARKRKIIRDNPFENFPIKAGEYDRTTLSKDEVQLLADFKPQSNAQMVAQDFFLFACYTGMHYGDVKNLRAEHIHQDGDARYISIRRQKNRNDVTIPLQADAIRILEKHKLLPRRDEELLLLYTNQKINEHLKTIAKACGIAKKLTCKVARHTFATAALNNGVSLEQTGSMLGHTNPQTTRIYGKMSLEGLRSAKTKLKSMYN